MSKLDGNFDAVIDVARHPSQVRAAVATLAKRTGHWSFVSTCSVYADDATPFQTTEGPLKEAAPPDVDETDMQFYGQWKVTCEQLVLETGLPVFIDRAGLIVGPGAAENRFHYWVSRLARGGEILAPGTPSDHVQWIDVRDLADWHVRAASSGQTGIYDGMCTPITRGEFLDGIAAAVGVAPELTWVDQDFLAAQKVGPWMGERTLPMWLPVPEYAGFMARDTSPAYAGGLSPRPLIDTARDTFAWLETDPEINRRAGLTPSEESEVLAAWHAR
ncbi:reductase [Rhizocola hellebori]|uniref:Reductase n=1 Tax=Rhizocola hellebori TaxID=1392758 RepID=A0A8J3VLA3_9ACTN|nr:reductase [Rhizocola hellebori]